MVDYEYADLIDNADRLKTLIDPTSSYALAAAYAMGRAMDDEIIAAISGTAYTGETGSTATALPASQKITEASTGGLTLDKLRNAKQILDLADVDPSLPRHMVISPKGLSDLLNNTTITSSDYNTIKALVQGELNTFMGFNFIVSNRLSIASNKRLNLAFVGDGVKLALGQDVVTRIDERADKGYSTQVYVSMSMGAVRMEEAKCVTIESYEA